MIFEEEDIAKIIKTKDLANIGNKMLSTIRTDLAKIQNTKNPLTWNDLATQKYKDYLGDFWELKDGVENFLRSRNKAQDIAIINTAQKIVSIWMRAYAEFEILDSAIINYNKRFPNNQLKTIEEMTGLKIKASVKTDYFGY